MTKSSKFRINNPSRLWAVVIFILGMLLVMAGTLSFAFLETQATFQATQKFEVQSAQTHARRAAPIVHFFSFVTAYQIPDLTVWRIALSVPQDIEKIFQETKKLNQGFAESDQSISLQNLTPLIQDFQKKMSTLEQHLERSFILRRVVSSQRKNQLTQVNSALIDLQNILESVSTSKQTWVIIFQNSDELRATGGFAGSYALITIANGAIEELVIEDIYDADGQFTGYLEPPAGVREYTSGSRGMRLPDANWYPHFPKTAQTMLQFFALGNKRNIAGMVMINVSVGESFLKATGPIWLPDYSTRVDAGNLRNVLREERDEFFPGSIQKKHILSQTFSVLKQKLAELPPAQQAELLKTISTHFTTKDIQLFAVNPDLQTLFEKYGVDGRLGLHSKVQLLGKSWCETKTTCSIQPAELYLVESNVGINKANRFITRTVAISSPSQKELQVKINFLNNGPLSTTTLLSQAVGKLGNPKLNLAENGYANYQRVLISPEYRLEKVTANGQEITKIDQEVVKTSTETPLTQYGFLITVVPESAQTVELSFVSIDPTFSLTAQPLLIQKQSGLPLTPYSIFSELGEQSFLLERDSLITWK